MATPITASSPVAARVRAGGVREVTLLAYPIVLTQMSQTVMHVVDRSSSASSAPHSSARSASRASGSGP
jgi:hypothetical protein